MQPGIYNRGCTWWKGFNKVMVNCPFKNAETYLQNFNKISQKLINQINQEGEI